MLRETGFYPFLKNAKDPNHWEQKKHKVDRIESSQGGFEAESIQKKAVVWIDTPASTEWARDGKLFRRRGTGPAAEFPAAQGGYENRFEVDVVARFLGALRPSKGAVGKWPETLMILAPYMKQVLQLQNKMRLVQASSYFSHLSHLDLASCVSTVDSAQGRQADLVVVSLVRNNPTKIDLRDAVGSGGRESIQRSIQGAFGFLESNQRSGVMFSRAESLLAIVGCGTHFDKLSGDDAKYLGVESSIARVYDFVRDQERGVYMDAYGLLSPHEAAYHDRTLPTPGSDK